MSQYLVKESDWIIFRHKVGDWQEDAMEKLNREYIEILSLNRKASENYWTLLEKIDQDRSKTTLKIQMRRSKLIENILALIKEGTISLDDLTDFSDELQGIFKTLLN